MTHLPQCLIIQRLDIGVGQVYERNGDQQPETLESPLAMIGGYYHNKQANGGQRSKVLGGSLVDMQLSSGMILFSRGKEHGALLMIVLREKVLWKWRMLVIIRLFLWEKLGICNLQSQFLFLGSQVLLETDEKL